MTVKLVECIPNFSEARRPEVVNEIVSAVASVPGVRILDQHSDLDHNRTVLTFVGNPEAVEAGAFAGIAAAARLINLEQHQGEHPRIGAADVVPFVPLSGVTMAECIEISRRLGQKVAQELGLPVYFYEDAAIRQDRRNLEDIRRGEYEGLKDSISSDPYRTPDLGPAELGPAGATVIGARQPLIAYNIYLTTADVSIAEKIARRVRHSSGGFHYVKAMGVLVNGLAQVSMNLTNFHRSPMAQVTEMVRREAQRFGVAVHHSEIVGLVPNQALINASRYYLQLDGFENEQLLESRVFDAGLQDQGTTPEQSDFIDAVAEGTPAPGGGSAAAYSGALAAALVLMVARLTVGKPKYQAAEAECWQIITAAESLCIRLREGVKKDALAFDGILAARRLPKQTPSEQESRQEAIRLASLEAAAVPLDSARDSLAVMKLSVRLAQIGNLNAISDAGAGVYLAGAAVKAACLNVRINLTGYAADPSAQALLTQTEAVEKEAEALQTAVGAILRERGGI